jgi:RimJ/RimL family protein N-acetyltransferase
MNKYKTNLIIRSFHKGFRIFLRQVFQILRDKIIGPKFLIYTLNENDLTNENLHYIEGFIIQSYDNWLQIDPYLKDVIQNEFHDEYWGEMKWFDLGWKFWIGTIDDHPVILSWTRNGLQSMDFYCPLDRDTILVWQTVTNYKYRGRGLLSIMLYHISRISLEQNYTKIYGSCRDYNYPSRKAMLNVGFKLVGYANRYRLTGKRAFSPATTNSHL